MTCYQLFVRVSRCTCKTMDVIVVGEVGQTVIVKSNVQSIYFTQFCPHVVGSALLEHFSHYTSIMQYYIMFIFPVNYSVSLRWNPHLLCAYSYGKHLTLTLNIYKNSFLSNIPFATEEIVHRNIIRQHSCVYTFCSNIITLHYRQVQGKQQAGPGRYQPLQEWLISPRF